MPFKKQNHSLSTHQPIILLIILMVLAFLMLAWLSVAKYHGYNLVSFDLGNISQAIWSVTQGEPLVFTTLGIEWSRLSLHVELFYFLLAPFYALRPAPDTLLYIQAALYVLGAWPLYHFAYRRLANEWAALGMVVVYLLYPVGQTAVLFQFHGDTLAVPFLLFAIDAMDRKSWRSYGIWLLLALSCKFYVAVPVAVLGSILWLKGERKAGLSTILFASLWGIVAFTLIRPMFASADSAQTGASINYYLEYYFSQFFVLDKTLLERLGNGLVVFAPVLLLAIRAPLWVLPAIAVTIPAMFSNGPGPSYAYRYHHYALTVPFLMASAVYGLERLRHRAESTDPPSKWTNYVWITVALTFVFSIMLVSTPLSPIFYLANHGTSFGMDDAGYGQTDRDRFKDKWLATEVPAEAPLIANDEIGFHLINRPVFYLIHMHFAEVEEVLPKIEYALIDSLNDYALGSEDGIILGGVAAEYQFITQLVKNPDFHLLKAQDGLLLFAREGEALVQTVTVQDADELSPALAQFEDAIALIGMNILPLEDNRYRLTYTWQALSDLNGRSQLIAVSQLEGVPHTRIVHLPTATLAPTTTWKQHQLITETFEICLPDHISLEKQPLTVGWYDTGNLFAAQTDERSRLGDAYQLTGQSLP